MNIAAYRLPLLAALALLTTGCSNHRAEQLLNQPEDVEDIIGPVDVDDELYVAEAEPEPVPEPEPAQPEPAVAAAPDAAPADGSTQTISFDGPDAEPEPSAPIGGMQPKRKPLGSMEIFGISRGGPG